MTVIFQHEGLPFAGKIVELAPFHRFTDLLIRYLIKNGKEIAHFESMSTLV
jgi:hypothetical protein